MAYKQTGTIKNIDIGKLLEKCGEVYTDDDIVRHLHDALARPFADEKTKRMGLAFHELDSEYWKVMSGLMHFFKERDLYCHTKASFYRSVEECREKDWRIQALQNQLSYCRKYNQTLPLYDFLDGYGIAVLPSGEAYILPAACMEYTLFPDYSDMPMALLRGTGSANLPPSVFGEEVTENAMKGKLEEKKSEIETAMEEIKAEEKKKQDEIEAMKAQIEKMYAAKLDALDEKKAMLEEEKERLENQIFVLDTEIYGIRCYNGETVSFIKVAEGENMPEEEPVVVYQKVRYLDEELSKAVSIYGIDGDEESLDMFEDLVAAREDIRDIFFPPGKSISLVRISADGKVYRPNTSVNLNEFGGLEIENILETYQVYHGTKTGILVRNGGNCYIGWTETDRINVKEDLFRIPKKEEYYAYEEAAYVDEDRYAKKHSDTKEDVVSRYFVFSILQGLIEKTHMIDIPEGNVFHPDSKNIIFSMADGWLSDNRFGSLQDILEKTNVQIQKGDDLLTLTSLRAEKGKDYQNARGIGYADRTHDVQAENCAIYPVNLVRTKYRKYVVADNAQGFQEKFQFMESDYTLERFLKQNGDDPEYTNPVEMVKTKTEVFISLKKTGSRWVGYDLVDAKGRANFELYHDEYMNLTFLNTVYLKQVLITRNVGNDRNFSSYVPYLNKAMAYLKNREETESALIRQYIPDLPDEWQVALSEWKMEHNVHRITDYQAKRFAKFLSEKER